MYKTWLLFVLPILSGGWASKLQCTTHYSYLHSHTNTDRQTPQPPPPPHFRQKAFVLLSSSFGGRATNHYGWNPNPDQQDS
jgi:hypothetical protein